MVGFLKLFRRVEKSLHRGAVVFVRGPAVVFQCGRRRPYLAVSQMAYNFCGCSTYGYAVVLTWRGLKRLPLIV